MSDKILIIGLGSIGQRHARNALTLGCEVVGHDTRQLFDVPPMIDWVENIEQGLALKPLGVIVATPPDTHWQIGFQISKTKLPCLIEKPISSDLSGAVGLCHAFEKQGVSLAVGYQFRHTAAPRRLKAQADADEFGTIYAAHAEFASRQWCSKTYPADLLLECSHELDLLRWFLGDPIAVVGKSNHSGAVEHAIIDCIDAVATVHLDILAPDYRRRLTLHGTKGQGEWSLDQAENDQAYIDELAEFLRICRGEQVAPSCTGRDGWWAVRMVEAIRRSGESGKWEAV